MGGEAAQDRYRSRIETEHPVLAELFGEPGNGSLETLIGALKERCEYSRFTGFVPFDRVRETLAARPDRKLALNCGTLASLLVAALRARGWSAEDAWVVVGEPRGREGQRGVDLHAWILVRRAGRLLWIDSMDLEPRPADGRALLDEHTIYVAFNDRHLLFAEPDKRRLLLGSGAYRFYVFGRLDPELDRLLADSTFRRRLPELLAGGAAGEPDEGWLGAAERCGVVDRNGTGVRAGRRLVMLDAAAEGAVCAAMAPHVDRYVEIGRGSVGELERAFAGTSEAHRFSWTEVVHTVVAGLCMDLAVGAALDVRRRIESGHGPSTVWAFERVSATNAFGVRWRSAAPDGACRGLGQLWHRRVRRRRPYPPGRDLVAALIGAAGGEEVGRADELRLRHLGLLAGDRGRARPALPAFLPEDCDRLLAALSPAGRRLAEEAVEPALAAAAAAVPLPGLESACLRLLLEYATDAMIEAAVLPPFPAGEEPSPAWGRWLWIERPETAGLGSVLTEGPDAGADGADGAAAEPRA